MTVHADRLLPHASEAEEAVLGACLIDNKRTGETDNTAFGKVKSILQPAMFYHKQNKLVYEAMQRLDKAGTPIDEITLAHQLDADKTLDEVGGTARLAHLTWIVPTPIHAPWYANIVRDMYKRRLAITRGAEMVADGFEGKTPKAPENQGIDV